MRDQEHSHIFYGTTTCNDRHIHRYAGVTSLEPTGIPHIHILEGKTSFSSGHCHEIRIRSSQSMQLPDGSHTHYYEDETVFEDGHIHFVFTYTSID